jgi:hypothetical protein
MPNSVADRRTAPPPPAFNPAFIAIAVAAVLLVLFLLSGVGKGPSMISQVTVVNQTPYQVTVNVAGSAKGETTALGIVGPKATAQFGQVVDEGPTWYVGLTSGPVSGGTLVLSRQDLVANGWRIVIGPDIGARLGAAGLAPPPG